jgi:lipooligosaccharide transport system permease protein
VSTSTLVARVVPLGALGTRRAGRLLERNLLVTRHIWPIVASGFFEPVFYLLSLGIGMGELVGAVEVGGRLVDYRTFVAPAMLASSAMNGAIFDTTFNFFYKLRYAKIYDAILSTPLAVGDVALGETLSALARGGIYAAAFLLVMLCLGLIGSAWAVLALPAALLIGFAFAGAGLACTTFMRSWTDFDSVQLVILPMFLFSTTFVPLSTYPLGLRWVVQVTPLYHGVALLRGLCTGAVGLSLLVHVAYLAGMGLLGLVVAGRRMERLLLA